MKDMTTSIERSKGVRGGVPHIGMMGANNIEGNGQGIKNSLCFLILCFSQICTSNIICDFGLWHALLLLQFLAWGSEVEENSLFIQWLLQLIYTCCYLTSAS